MMDEVKIKNLLERYIGHDINEKENLLDSVAPTEVWLDIIYEFKEDFGVDISDDISHLNTEDFSLAGITNIILKKKGAIAK